MNALTLLLARTLWRIGDRLVALGTRVADAGLVILGVDLSTPPASPDPDPPAGWTSPLEPVPTVPPAGEGEQASAAPQVLH